MDCKIKNKTLRIALNCIVLYYIVLYCIVLYLLCMIGVSVTQPSSSKTNPYSQ